MSPNTVKRGMAEIYERQLTSGIETLPRNIREAGGGRLPIEVKDTELVPLLDRLIDPAIGVDPMTALRWTSQSTYRLAAALSCEGHKVSPRTVARLLLKAGYSLQGNSKTGEGLEQADINAQFEFINKRSQLFMRQKQPVISVEAKKRENVGLVSNKGREGNSKGKADKGERHDFADLDLGQAIPHGDFDFANNQGWVRLCLNNDSADFVVATIRRWWEEMGQALYGDAIKKLYINADAGGSDSRGSRLWKASIQKFANELEVPIHVSYLPPGTSKWNKVEHRLCSQISKDWRGRKLTSLRVIVNLIANSATDSGLKAKKGIDSDIYLPEVKESHEEYGKINLKPAKFQGEWNYCIVPDQ
jgi:hypothetical protein